MNPVINYLDPAAGINFVSSVTYNRQNCASVVNDGAGLAGSFLTFPNNNFVTNYYSYLSVALDIPVSHPSCLKGVTPDGPGVCTLAQTSRMIFFTDSNELVSEFPGSPCMGQTYAFNLGQNIGAFISVAAAEGTICAGAGGDPHVFTFNGTDIILPFELGKKYLLYGAPDFKVVIHTTGISTRRVFITSIGVTLHSHHLLAALNETGDPQFYFDGELIVDRIPTGFGDAKLFNPQSAPIREGTALYQERRYQTTGLIISGLLEIIGGYHPGSGGFFNIEFRESSQSDFGLLRAAVGSRARDADFLSAFETDSLF
jgi:hypothetical protein